jgi:hypothetical protein
MGTSTINVFKDAEEFPTTSSNSYFISAFVRKIVSSIRQIQHKGTNKKKEEILSLPCMYRVTLLYLRI